jgi:hypothetical protein
MVADTAGSFSCSNSVMEWDGFFGIWQSMQLLLMEFPKVVVILQVISWPALWQLWHL